MSERAVAAPARRRRTMALRFALILLIALLIMIRLFAAGERPLKPLRPAAAPTQFLETNGQPVLIGFRELHADPFAMLGNRLRMTGEYVPLEAEDCRNRRGPAIAWSIVAEDLQLNATGYEAILKPLPEGTVLTIDGTWRLYDGPLGCGKAPPAGTVWYLEVEQIVQPNPLFSIPDPQEGMAAEGIGSPTVGGTPDPQISGEEGDGGSEVQGTATAPGSDETPPILFTTPSPTSTPTRLGTPATPFAATATSISPTRTPTSLPSTGTPPTRTPTATSTGSGPVVSATPTIETGPTSTPFPTAPPLTTSTPGTGYPGPSGTSTPTGTPDSYP